MKRAYIKLGVFFLFGGWMVFTHAMKLNDEAFEVQKIEVGYLGKTVLHVFPVAFELQLLDNRVEKFRYALLGKNRSNDKELHITKNEWSDFAINYSNVQSMWEYARQLGRGLRYVAWEQWTKKVSPEGPLFTITIDDVTNASYGLLELFTNDMYTRYDILEEKDRHGKLINPIKIYIKQTGQAIRQVTDIVVFITLQVRKSITALDTDGKNKFKDKFLWYPVNALKQATDLSELNINKASVDYIKRAF